MTRTLFGLVSLGVASLLLASSTSAALLWQEWKSGIDWPEPAVVDPGGPGKAPADAIVLFDGTNLDAFEGGEKWKISEEGYAEVGGGSLATKQAFGDMQLHLEFASPEKVEGKGQGRGNSGVYLMRRYELQILDSYENETYFDGQCGSIYKQAPPIVNACRAPGEWQSYDIIFTAPRFADDGELLTPGYVTVLHNGVVIHNHYELQGSTSYTAPPSYGKHPEKLPFLIQNHGDKVRFRNIWVRENVHKLEGKLPEAEAEEPKAEKGTDDEKPKEEESTEE